MSSPLERAREEFARQARGFSAAPALRAERAIEPFVRLLGPPAGGPVLDLACGPGIVADALGRAGHRVVALDATRPMLERARVAAPGAAPCCAAAERLPFAAGALAGAVSRLALHHLAEPARALAELRRALRPGAPLVIGDIVCSGDRAEAELHNALETLRDPSHQRFLAEPELLAAIGSAGFAVQACERWEQARRFDEWAAIVADARSLEPLGRVMRALARAGLRAGIELCESQGALTFVHAFRFVQARAA